MPKKFTKASEQRLLSALNDISELTDSGMHPNDAIAKIASEKNIPNGHVHLLVSAYNTGRSTAQRRSSDNIWEKAATFPIADASSVIDKLYPTKIKSAVDITNETVISKDYNRPPSWVKAAKAKPTLSDLLTKEASVKSYEKEDNSFEKAKTEFTKLSKVVDEARLRASAAFDLANNIKADLITYFKSANALNFNSVKSNCILKYGSVAERLFEEIASEDSKITKQTKQANHYSTDAKPYEFVKQCMELHGAYKALHSDYLTKLAELQQLQNNIHKNFVKEVKHPILGTPIEKKALFSSLFGAASGPAEVAKSTNPLLRFNPFAMYRPVGNIAKRYNDLKNKAQDDLLQKAIENKVKADMGEGGSGLAHHIDTAYTQNLLTNLLANDEQLRHSNPHEVLQAYSRVRHSFPRIAGNEDMLRHLLRLRMVAPEQGLDHYKLMTDVEKNLHTIHQDRFEKPPEESKPNKKPGKED